ncbi:MAG TPA: TIGR03557 family F420-dependent LLM class oxidoreductase [Actinomycetota bacterium]
MATDIRFGYALSSEEHRPRDLVAYASKAEDVGFDFAMVSDHFHPWTDKQGQSPFVWSVLGGIAAATQRITVGTGVTALSMRIHPAILAQAAATTADMLPGRFWFGVGTGENLNEHILGDAWPEHDARTAMLEEAVALIRRLWTGELVSHRGEFYDVSRARIYTIPDDLPPIMIAASGPETAEVAGRISDGLITTAPEKELLQAFGKGRKGASRLPKLGQASVCWAASEKAARKTAFEWWPTGAIPGDSSQELALPSSFESIAKLVTEDQVAEQISCGPDPEVHLAKVQPFLDAGFDHVYLHQIGPDQAGFLRFAERELLPRLTGRKTTRRRAA